MACAPQEKLAAELTKQILADLAEDASETGCDAAPVEAPKIGQQIRDRLEAARAAAEAARASECLKDACWR